MESNQEAREVLATIILRANAIRASKKKLNVRHKRTAQLLCNQLYRLLAELGLTK